MKDSIYLKEYVQLHPENKMGWYLLGKEYEKNGEEGKANYCFNQSSEVYEAFEKSKVPDDVWKEYEDRIVQTQRHKERRTYKFKVFLLSLVMLLLIFTPSIHAPGQNEVGVDWNDLVEEPEKVLDNVSVNKPEPNVEYQFTAHLAGSNNAKADLFAKIMSYSGSLPTKVAVLGMQQQDKWLIWKRNMPLSFTMMKTNDTQIVYQSYDSKECDCTVPDAVKIEQSAQLWTKKQEELAILSNAIGFFTKEKGRHPTSFNELVQPFPNNRISGSTQGLKENFNQINMAMGASSTHSEDSANIGSQDKETLDSKVSKENKSVFGDDIFFEHPLEIVVDKQNYRLAVVSGNMILRNYEVGLGGDKTPESSFVISDKVVNPNGRSNGEFGSRGMQLSTSNYAIHGTDEPASIGRDESKGCIRMKKEDVEELFDLIPMGTKVSIGKGVLPDAELIPEQRYRSQHRQNQSNPHKIYRWLN
ncbi:L,D-transpeptidase [Paenibacillus sp. CMAA1364]